VLACPVCRLALVADGREFGCAAGHRFDRAREGYVNLLRPGRARRARSGDDDGMVRARRSFLAAGHYDGLRSALAHLLVGPGAVLDVGCGEGSFTAALTGVDREVVGVDISRPAVRLAARLVPEATFAVATVQELPVLDGACDWVVSVMAPVHEGEFLRVVRPGGCIVVVVPGADHLDGLRRLLYAEYRPHDEGVPLTDRLEVVDRRRVRAATHLATADEVQQVWAMTPYRWAAPVESAARLADAGAGGLDVTVDFLLTVLRAPPVATPTAGPA
jgi:23S rRNA (guanine745-N1)-methyltransferase